jgi:hypothetical protein
MAINKEIFEEMTSKLAEEALDECFQELVDIYFAQEPEGGLKGRVWRTLNLEETPRKVTPITLFMKEMYKFEKEYGEEKNKKSLARQRKRYKNKLQSEQDRVESAERLNKEMSAIIEEYDVQTSEEQILYLQYLAEDLKQVIKELEACRQNPIKPEKLKSFCLKNKVKHLGYEGL